MYGWRGESRPPRLAYIILRSTVYRRRCRFRGQWARRDQWNGWCCPLSSAGWFQPFGPPRIYFGAGLAEALRRTDPTRYNEMRQAGYLRAVGEDRPAVISVNMMAAAMATNEFLARLHPYRNQPNQNYNTIRADLAEVMFDLEPEGSADEFLQRVVGNGDVTPLLGRPSLS